MTTYLSRSAWTKVPAAGATMPSKPKGIAVHWPGSTTVIGSRPQANMAARLEGYRRFHVYDRGWDDIAYQVGIDQDGRVWDLRGIGRESAANGDQTVNLTYLACLFLVGVGEAPSPALLTAFNDWRRTRALVKYPTATRVVGHRDIRPTGGTDCPGPSTEALIKSGRILTAQPDPQEDDMPTPAEYAQAVAEYEVTSGSKRIGLGLAAGRAAAFGNRNEIQLTALTAAVAALAAAVGADPAAIEQLVSDKVDAALADLHIVQGDGS